MKIQEQVIGGSGREKVVIIELHGQITPREDRNGVSLEEKIGAQLSRARNDPRVRAVILEISSPGGEVSVTDRIFKKILEHDRHQPVVAYIRDIGASGAYYIACGASAIVAHETALVGSIGVIMRTFNVEGLLEKVGVKSAVIASGAWKDSGSPFRAMSDEEKKHFQDIVDVMHQKFVAIVKEARPKIPEDKIADLTSGKVFLSPEAQANGLIDGVGYLEGAAVVARTFAQRTYGKIIPSVTLVRYSIKQRTPFLARLFSFGTTFKPLEEISEMLSFPPCEFSYLWLGPR